MQLPDVKKFLEDILLCIDAVKLHTKGIANFPDFTANRTVYRAVERELEIIAEALTRIKNTDPSIVLSHSKQIIGLRNRVIHSYDNVNEDIIWGVVINHLDDLKTEVVEILKKLE